MKFALMIAEVEDERHELSRAEVDFDTLVRWWADVRSRVNVVASGRLAPKGTARTISWRDQAPIVTDGPFIEAKESIAGFLVVDVEDEAAAIELASTWLVKVGFKIEVRAIQGSPGE